MSKIYNVYVMLIRQWVDGEILKLKKATQTLYVAYTSNCAARDEQNRKPGLQRLEKQIKAGKLTKSNVVNKSYEKYLKMQGNVNIEIDYEKYHAIKFYDGLKGYLTNTKLSGKRVIENHLNLRHIEKSLLHLEN